MKKLIYLSIILLYSFLDSSLYSQNFYYGFDQPIALVEQAGKYTVKFDEVVTRSYAEEQLTSITNLAIIKSHATNLFEINYSGSTANIASINGVISVQPVFYTQNGTQLLMSDQILFKPKPDAINYLNILQNLGLINYQTNTLYSIAKITTGQNIIALAQLLYESGSFIFAYPNFWAKAEKPQIPNDTYFNKQFGFYNTGQIINDGNSGTPGADIKAPAAWDITTGNPDIVIAVIDEGVTDNHFDLPSNRQLRLAGSNFEAPFIDQFDPYNIQWDPTGHLSDDPSPALYANHGNSSAGLIAATQNNNEGITGVAPDCKVMPIRIPYYGAQTSVYADAVNFARNNGADIIHFSVAFYNEPSNFIPALNLAIDDAILFGRGGKGSIVVIPAGNQPPDVSYPANYIKNGSIAVGASDRDDLKSLYSPVGNEVEVTAPSNKTLLTGEIWTLDVPGTNGYNPTWNSFSQTYEFLPNSGPNFDAYTGRFSGTSAAGPIVAGISALILSVNPCLMATEIEEIIKNSADKVGGYDYNWNGSMPGHSQELGYGRVDAYEAVLLTQATYPATFDLYTKDSYNDFGVEPNITTTYPWLSEDIWVRNTNDGLTDQTNQNPEHSSTNDPAQLNYVYVRVRNKSCVASDGTETLDLHWAKASTSLNYPANWNGSLDLLDGNLITLPNAIAGNLISSQTIPAIPAGGEVILEFTWNPPSPDDYSFNSEPWHFCLLSKIVSTADPITPFTSIGAYVTENNNVAWKNLTVVDNVLGIIVDGDCPQDVMQNIGVAVAVANPDNIAGTFDIKFSVPQEELSNPITTEGKITIALDEQLYEKWKQGGKKGTGFTEIKSPPMSENGANNNNINDNAPITVSNRQLFEITGTSSSFDNIALAPNEVRTTSLMVTYPTNPVSEKKLFNYDIVQKRSETGELIGGVRYAIQKPDCSNLIVDAGSNQTIKRGCSAALVAFSSSPLQLQLGKDCSSYQWFDDSGKLIAEQSAVKITPNTTTTYTLKFTSTSGCTSEDQVTITVLNQLCKKEREIIKINPNPANDFITIDYKALNTNNAHIRLLKTDNSIDRTYPLDLQNTQKTINVADCNFGSYVMMLVCDGINEDSEIVIIQ